MLKIHPQSQECLKQTRALILNRRSSYLSLNQSSCKSRIAESQNYEASLLRSNYPLKMLPCQKSPPDKDATGLTSNSSQQLVVAMSHCLRFSLDSTLTLDETLAAL